MAYSTGAISAFSLSEHVRHLHRSQKPARRKPGLITSRSELLAAAVLRVWVFSSACGCFPPRMGVPRNKCQLSGFLLNEDLARSLISAGGPDQSSLLLRCCIRLASNFRKWASDAAACASSSFSRFQGDATYTHVHTYARTLMHASCSCTHACMYACISARCGVYTHLARNSCMHVCMTLMHTDLVPDGRG